MKRTDLIDFFEQAVEVLKTMNAEQAPTFMSTTSGILVCDLSQFKSIEDMVEAFHQSTENEPEFQSTLVDGEWVSDEKRTLQ